ncbi:MAG: YggS family pyridoxal phosphate-dependent enzyme [Sphaerochaetaceae bacterium]|nr:YggS family pyridoxal phosphate-dependent enzyme [Sphaerochaetaceae bacterium]
MITKDYKTIIDNFKAEIGQACLMAVSKTRSLEEIMAVYQTGQRLFGENHVQEIVEKFSTGKPEDMEVHMIGHLQSNKVNKVVPLVDMIESVDSVSLLSKIDVAASRIGKTMNVLLEFNTSGEEAKSGFESRESLFEALDLAKTLDNVKICGLMTVGPVSCAPEDKERLTDKAFKELRLLKDECKKLYPELNFDVLSMGMSDDYMIGVKNGSTEVRIGTAIFGARDYSKK